MARVCTMLLLAALRVDASTTVRDNLYGIEALSAKDAWAVGNFGSILRTNDGGRTWEPRDSGTKNSLFSVDFADDQHGWVVGKSALILHTTDGGTSWTQQKTPVPGHKHLFKVRALDVHTAWAVGDWGAITTTRDGGEHWEDRSLGAIVVKTESDPARGTVTLSDDVILYDVSFPDARHGYISGEFGTVLATTDGGETWEARATGTEKTLYGVHFNTPESGWAVGIDGLVLRTRDGGATWQVQRGAPQLGMVDDLGFLEVIKNPGLYAVRVVGGYGVVVGDTGTILTSGDGGETWSRQVLPERQRLTWMRDVSLVPGTHGFAVGAAGFAAVVERTQVRLPDGGEATPAATP